MPPLSEDFQYFFNHRLAQIMPLITTFKAVASKGHPSVYPTIHPFSVPTYPLEGHKRLQPIPLFNGREAGYKLDRLPVYHTDDKQTNCFTPTPMDDFVLQLVLWGNSGNHKVMISPPPGKVIKLSLFWKTYAHVTVPAGTQCILPDKNGGMRKAHVPING